jgi:peroxiredoxin Q/BCP
MNRDFAKSLELDYPILSDPDKTTARAYGVLNPEGQYARRHTIYIGADGKILYVDQAVKPMTAGEDVAARREIEPRAAK